MVFLSKEVSLNERTNHQWLEELGLPPPGSNQALTDLRLLIVRKLSYVFTSRTPGFEAARSRYSAFGGRDPGALAEDIAQEALVRILEKRGTFRGESRFTSWALRVAINLAYTELRRRHWKDSSLEALNPAVPLVAPSVLERRDEGPERRTMKRELAAVLGHAIQEGLTGHQRAALLAVVMQGMPIEEVARRLNITGNALYKTLHDARKRLKSSILKSGFSPADVQELLD